MNAAPDSKHGKEFEGTCSDAFSKLYTRYQVRWERTLDTGAAGNLVRAAPDDFRFLVKSSLPGQPFVFNIECKASVSEKPFQNNFRQLVKKGQNASLLMANRGGAIAFVLYYSLARGVVEVWDGKTINEWYPLKGKSMKESPPITVAIASLPSLAETIASSPRDFISTLRPEK